MGTPSQPILSVRTLSELRSAFCPNQSCSRPHRGEGPEEDRREDTEGRTQCGGHRRKDTEGRTQRGRHSVEDTEGRTQRGGHSVEDRGEDQ